MSRLVLSECPQDEDIDICEDQMTNPPPLAPMESNPPFNRAHRVAALQSIQELDGLTLKELQPDDAGCRVASEGRNLKGSEQNLAKPNGEGAASA
jgi:hypothetical protein